MQSIDLLLWADENQSFPHWPLGNVALLSMSLEAAAVQLNQWARNSNADYLLLWPSLAILPDQARLEAIIDSVVDVAHCGLQQGVGETFLDLYMVKQDWSMINGSLDQISSTWKLSLETCLIKRDLLIQLGGIDVAFITWGAASLDLGYRYLNKGAIVEYHPSLCKDYEIQSRNPNFTPQDLYIFILRHYNHRWAKYVTLRRSLRSLNWIGERRSLSAARKRCEKVSPPTTTAHSIQYQQSSLSTIQLQEIPVSVVIPTLGRYHYIPQALESLRNQTIKPGEIIIVDQNPPEARQPDIYRGFEDLNLQIIWQDERGQSLARNTAISVASHRFILLFDDDSIAHPDLIEQHLRVVADGVFHVSTGVSYPPQPNDYELPPSFRYPRIAQTFDTGNSMISYDIFQRLNGLDRNYDFGSGTDLDFGTRLYLAGYRIAHNPDAMRIHFKAPMGGLRVHGAHKYTTDRGLLHPFPPVTQMYYALKYLTKVQRRERALIGFIKSKLIKNVHQNSFKKIFSIILFCFYLFLLPLKYYRSQQRASRLIKQGNYLEKI